MSAEVTSAPHPFEDRAEFAIPNSSIERWTEIHPEAGVILSLTRLDMDRFFFMHFQIGSALGHLQQAVIDLSNGKIEDAQKAMEESQRLNAVQLGNLRSFMASIMDRATPVGVPTP